MEHIAEWPTQHIHSLSSLCLLPLQRLEKLKPHFPKLPCSEAEGGPLMYLRLTKLSDHAHSAAGSRGVRSEDLRAPPPAWDTHWRCDRGGCRPSCCLDKPGP